MSVNSPENILLNLPDEQAATVRGIFDELAARGFPPQWQTPHITVTFSPNMAPHVVERAREILPSAVPSELSRRGVVVFGTGKKQTVAWLLEATDELENAARELSALNPDGRGPRWVPHLTVGLRLPRDIVPSYIDALSQITPREFKSITAVEAAYWRPSVGERVVLA